MYLLFDKIRYRNLLATGNVWTEFDFRDSPNTLIIGKNGSGKSTLLDALTFVLYGVPYREVNKPTLVNSQNGKGAEVEIEFKAGTNDYKVRRGIKPNVFEIFCNGKLIDQSAKAKDYQKFFEDTVLRMDIKTFTQVVILGKASFIPFMQLPAKDRRAVTETVIGLQIISTMAKVAKTRLDTLKKSDAQMKTEIDKLETELDLLDGWITESKKDVETRIALVQMDIDGHVDQLILIEEAIALYEQKQTKLISELVGEDTVNVRLSELGKLGNTLRIKKTKVENDIVFFHNHEQCPTCQQIMTEEHKAHMIIELEPKLDRLELGISKLNTTLSNTASEAATFRNLRAELLNVGQEISRQRAQKDSAKAYIEKRNKDIEAIKDSTKSVEANEARYEQVKLAVDAMKSERIEILQQIQRVEVSQAVLKDDGYKAQIVKKYIPVINNTVNKYLQAMGFHASFTLDEEFNETIKSRFIDDFSYENFSEGEKQRIDMALLFGWRAVAKTKGSIDTNLLIMDEIFDSSMDADGMDSLFGIFNAFSKDTNLFVISHRGEQLLDKFKKTLKFEKVKGYSSYKKV
jgi:DNA repair exonuclease SbcCD ATPase subunit